MSTTHHARSVTTLAVLVMALCSVGCLTDAGGGTAATVGVVAPDGGESFSRGEAVTITWTSAGVGRVRIELSRDDGSTWTGIVADTVSDGSYDWVVAGPSSATCRLRVSDTADFATPDESDGCFAIDAKIRNGIVFSTKSSVYVKCLDTDDIIWTHDFPAAVDHAVAVALRDGAGAHYVVVQKTAGGVAQTVLLDAGSGAQVWTKADTRPALVWGSGINRRARHPAYDDPIYFPAGAPGASDGVYVLTAASDQGAATVFRASDGSAVWSQALSTPFHNLCWIPDVNHDGAYDVVIAYEKTVDKVQCLDGTDGAELWSVGLADAAGGTPVPDANGDGVYDYAHGRIWNSTVYLRSGVDGSQLWSYTAPAFDGTADVVFPKPTGGYDVICSFQGGVPHRLTLPPPVSLVWTASGGPGNDSAYTHARLIATPTSYNVLCHWRSNHKISALDGGSGAALWTKDVAPSAFYVTLPDRNADGNEDVLVVSGGTANVCDGVTGDALVSLTEINLTDAAFLGVTDE